MRAIKSVSTYENEWRQWHSVGQSIKRILFLVILSTCFPCSFPKRKFSMSSFLIFKNTSKTSYIPVWIQEEWMTIIPEYWRWNICLQEVHIDWMSQVLLPEWSKNIGWDHMLTATSLYSWTFDMQKSSLDHLG
jgi:hypothetical protein